ncbi:phosphatase PAP2 family protein, partial [Halobacterium salinarum]|uniref:phosphatase PAP2 family protein n=1 Tax=Halobacterium salinarum TaxID=2242 RepID=UPI001F3A60FF
GGLAALVDVGGRRQRYAAGAAMVVVVSATRLALGVHYLVDVVAGAGVGVAVVGGVLAVTRRRVSYGFGLAVILAAGAVAVAGPTTDAVAALGGAAGGLVGWRIVAARGAVGRAVRPVAGVGAVVAAGGVAAASVGVGAGAIPVFGAHAAAGAVFVGLPAAQNFSR